MSWSGVITDAGVSLFNTGGSTGPLVDITGFILGDAYNYSPDKTSTTLTGSTVYTSTSSSQIRYLISSEDTVIFRLILDNTVGAVSFGEVALLSGSTLVSISANTTMVDKEAGSIYQLDIALKLANIANSIDVTVNTQDIAVLPSVADETALPTDPLSVPYNAYRVLDTTTSPTTRASVALASGSSWALLTAPAPSNIYQQIRSVTSTTLPVSPENHDVVRVTDLDDSLFMYNSTLLTWIQIN